MGLQVKRSSKLGLHLILTVTAVFALVAQPMYGPMASRVANAVGSSISIENSAQLCNAIKNQQDGQVWTISPGNYGIGPTNCTDIIAVNGNTNKYLPLTANNLTIRGVGNPTLYGQGYTSNGDGGFDGDFIAITGDNVTIKNVTVMTKIYPNKAIEVRGANSTIEGVHIKPNTLSPDDINPAYYPEWSALYAGTIYYHQATGVHSLKNTTVTNGGISLQSSNATFNLEGVKLNYRTNDDFLNSYRIYKPFASTVVNGSPVYTYEVSHALNNISSALKGMDEPNTVQGSETIKLISDLYVTEQISITKPNVTIDGAKAAGGQYTMFGTFDKTDPSNNSILGVQANGVQIKRLNINGQGHQLHGLNVWRATGVNVNNVSLTHNAQAGMVVGLGSNVTATDINTANNGWYGINVDKTGASLTIKGANSHTEEKHIVVGDSTPTAVTFIDQDKQYVKFTNTPAGNYYRLDISKPTVQILSPTDGKVVNGIISVSATMTDDTALRQGGFGLYPASARATLQDGNSHNELRIAIPGWPKDDVIGSQINGKATASLSRNLDTAALAEGQYLIRVGVDDSSNKRANHIVAFTVDRTAPKVDIQGAKQGDTVQGTLSLVGLVTDENRMNSHFQITGPNGYSRGFTSRDGQAQHNLSWNTQGLVDGLYTIKFEARDAAGNKDSATSVKSIKVTVDNTEPEVAILNVNAVNPTTALIKAHDLNLNRIDVSLWKEGQEKYVAFPGEWTTQQDFSSDYADQLKLTSLSDGKYEIRATATDSAGNPKNASSVFFTVDKTPPVVKINPIAPSTNTRPKISGSTEPHTSVVVRVGENVIGTVTSDADGNWSIIPEAALSIGKHTVVAVATDAAGNESSADTSSAQPYWTQFAITAPVGNGNTDSGSNSDTTTRTVQSIPTNPTPLTQSQFTALLDGTTVATDTTTTDTDNGEVAGVSDTNARNSTAEDEEKGEVLAAQDSKKSWSVVNLALSIFTVLVGLVSLAGAFTKRKEHENKHTAARVLTLVPTIGVVIAFFFLENLSLPLGWFNTWTILFGAVLIIQLILVSMGKSSQANE